MNKYLLAQQEYEQTLRVKQYKNGLAWYKTDEKTKENVRLNFPFIGAAMDKAEEFYLKQTTLMGRKKAL